MSHPSTAEVVRNNLPEVEDAFWRVEAALQAVSSEEIGLAVIIAIANNRPDYYNPLEPDLQTKIRESLLFSGHNMFEHPGPWQRRDSDAEDLGGELPPGIGTFTARALAKANTMNDDPRMNTSYKGGNINIGKGKIVTAGGARIGDSFVCVDANLPEPHLEIAKLAFLRECGLKNLHVYQPRTVNQLAEDMEGQFKLLAAEYEGDLTHLSRDSYKRLLAIARDNNAQLNSTDTEIFTIGEPEYKRRNVSKSR